MKIEQVDETTKAFYSNLFQNWGVKVETEREVFSRARKIDLVVTCRTEAERLKNTVFAHLRQLNAIEFKIYFSDDILERWIIHPSELDLVPKNYPLLPLARRKKLEQFIALCLDEGLNDYLQLIIDIGLVTEPELIWRKLLEVRSMKHMIREETWPIIDQFFQEMPEAIGKLPTFQDALSESLRQGFQDGERHGFQDGEQRGEH